jgi:hypothetical protein
VLGQRLRRKDEFLQGSDVLQILVVGVEGINRERSVHRDRFSLFAGEKHDPPAESPFGRLAWSVADGVGPDVGHLHGDLGFRLPAGPKTFSGQIELGTAG